MLKIVMIQMLDDNDGDVIDRPNAYKHIYLMLLIHYYISGDISGHLKNLKLWALLCHVWLAITLIMIIKA